MLFRWRLWIIVMMVGICACKEGSCWMTDKYLSVEELARLARIAETGSPDELLGGPSYSRPIPNGTTNGLEIIIFTNSTRGSHYVNPPSSLIRLDPRTGRLIEMKRGTLQQLGLLDISSDPQPTTTVSDELIMSSVRADRELIQLSPRVWLIYERNYQHHSISQGDKEVLRQYHNTFQQAVLSPVLRQYYRSVGKHFFTWLDQAIR